MRSGAFISALEEPRNPACYPKDVKHGLYHAARTVLEGHFRITGESYLTKDELSEWFWTYNEKDGIPKIEYPYGDYYYVSATEAMPHIILFYGWILSIVFAFVSLVVKCIRAVVRKVRKSDKKISLGSLTGLASINELLVGLAGLVLIVLVTGWFHHTTYLWIFPFIGVMTLVLAILTITMLIKFIKSARKTSVIRNIYNVFAILFALINVAFVILEKLWM